MLAIDFTGGGLPADQTANAYLFVGDHSSSNSEIYSLNVDGQTIEPSSHGEVARERGTFERGESYGTTVQWVSTDRTDEDGNDDPDYDYRAWVDRLANPRWTSGDSVPSSRDFFVTDDSQLFQRREFGDDTDSTVGKQATIHFPAIDLDIDSDNSGLINGSLSEDVIESDQKDGLEFSVFSGDIDGDDVPDNYDLDGIAGVRFTPIQVSLSSNLQYVGGSTSLTFEFDDAGLVLESDGLFRLWKKDAAANRTEADLIASDSPVNASDLGLEPGGTATLYLEAVNPTRRTVNFDPIKVTASVSSGVWDGTLTDKVHVKGKKVAIDVSVNGDDDLTDPVDGIDKFLPGYEGDNAVLTAENQQTVKLIITGLEAGSAVNLSLTETTKLTGLAGNAGGSDAFDYQFSNGGQQIEGLVAGGDGTLAVELNVLDFGGKTIVKVSAADGVELATLSIPLDGDGDSLPDVFEDRYDGLDKTKAQTTVGTNDDLLDEDVHTVGTGEARTGEVKGDLLGAFDEYRGFILKGVHERTNPQVKEIFVLDSLGDIGVANKFRYFDTLGVKLHEVGTDEFETDTFVVQGDTHAFRMLNFNSEAQIKLDVIVVENKVLAQQWGRQEWASSGASQRERLVYIDVAQVRGTKDIVKVLDPDSAGQTAILYENRNNQFVENGEIKIGNDEYLYDQSYHSKSDVDLPVGHINVPGESTTILINDLGINLQDEEYSYLRVKETNEVIEVDLGNDVSSERNFSVEGVDDRTTSFRYVSSSGTFLFPTNTGEFKYLRLGTDANAEWVKFTSYDRTTQILTVERGQLGTTGKSHGNGISEIDVVAAPAVGREPGGYVVGMDASTSGNGAGALFNIEVAVNGSATVTILDSGNSFTVGETITIPDASLGGGGGVDLTFTVEELTNVSVFEPAQISNVQRGMFGTTAAIISVGQTLQPVGIFTNVRATNGGGRPPANSTKVNSFSDANTQIQLTVAHELAHALLTEGTDHEHGINPGNESIQRSIMRAVTKRGAFAEGIGEARFYTEFSDDTRESLDLLWENGGQS